MTIRHVYNIVLLLPRGKSRETIINNIYIKKRRKKGDDSLVNFFSFVLLWTVSFLLLRPLVDGLISSPSSSCGWSHFFSFVLLWTVSFLLLRPLVDGLISSPSSSCGWSHFFSFVLLWTVSFLLLRPLVDEFAELREDLVFALRPLLVVELSERTLLVSTVDLVFFAQPHRLHPTVSANHQHTHVSLHTDTYYINVHNLNCQLELSRYYHFFDTL